MKQYIFLLKIRISQWLILIFLLAYNSVNAQSNLVINGNFETYNICPSNTNNYYPTNWYSAGKNSGGAYYNVCSNDFCIAPPVVCCAGDLNYQVPKSGNTYIGLLYLNQGIGSNKRNYIQTKLNDSLKQGLCYVITYYVNLCENSMYACNNIAALLTKTAVYVDTMFTPYGVLPATPQILNYGNPIITDTLNWVKVSSVYTAQGGEQYLTLGNFKYDNQTNYQIVNVNGYQGTAYLIDDVSVIPLDSMPLKADAGRDTTIKVGDSIFIGSLTNGLTNVKWYDSNNNEILNKAGVPGFYVTPSNTTFYVIEQMVCGNYSKDTIHIIVQPLPLKFINYTVSIPLLGGVRGGLIQNSWVTASEINVSHFNVLRSENGRDFKIMGKVKANNKVLNEYNFIDEPTRNEQQETWFYKIAAVDNDGKLSYSEVKKLNINHSSLNVNIYPNPAKDVVNINCIGMKEINIINSLGQVVYKQIATGTNLRNDTIIIDTKNLNKGLYIVQIITKNNEIKNEKLVVE